MEPSPVDQVKNPPGGHKSLDILREIIFHPGEAFKLVVALEKKATWVLPIVVSLVLVLAAALAAHVGTSTAASTSAANRTVVATVQTTRTTTANRGGTGGQQNPGGAFPGGGAPPGGDFGGMQFPGQVQGGNTNRTTSAGSGTTAAQPVNVWLSVGVTVAGFLLSWLILGVLTNLFSLAWGGRSNALMALNIAGWSSLPIGVRNLMHIIYYLSTGTAVTMPGLSGFAPSSNGNAGLVFLQNLLSHVDIYLVWQIVLLAIGVGTWGALSRKKSLPIAILGVLLVVVLTSLVGVATSMLGNMNLNTNMLLRMR